MSEQVICLSDSDESVRSVTNEKSTDHSYGKDADFDFPPVEFTYCVNESLIGNGKKNDKDGGTACKTKSTDVVEKYGNYENHKETERSKSPEYAVSRPIDQRLVRDKDADNVENLDRLGVGKRIISANQTDGNKKKGKQRGATDTDRETRANQIAIEKCLKLAERKNLKRIQPGECMKYMRVYLHRGLEDFSFYRRTIEMLVDSDISWDLEDLSVANSIVWKRKTEEHYVNESNEICIKSGIVTEKQILIIWNREETAARVKEGSFVGAIENAINLVPGMRPMLILYDVEDYSKNRDREGKQSSKAKSKEPKISRSALEICLAEIQLLLNCSSQLVDTPDDFASLVCRFTKSIAEIPYKLDKKQKLEEKLDWYATGDNKDTVRVDKSGNGLKRLWQQQLCQFNLASLETAESVSLLYQSPLQLMEAYRNCSADEGEKLLKDIPIRRAAGPLSTVRKIGPELSKKIFIMFTSSDGDATLGNDKEL